MRQGQQRRRGSFVEMSQGFLHEVAIGPEPLATDVLREGRLIAPLSFRENSYRNVVLSRAPIHKELRKRQLLDCCGSRPEAPHTINTEVRDHQLRCSELASGPVGRSQRTENRIDPFTREQPGKAAIEWRHDRTLTCARSARGSFEIHALRPPMVRLRLVAPEGMAIVGGACTLRLTSVLRRPVLNENGPGAA